MIHVKKRWTKEETNFLIDNYPSKGASYCAKHLGYKYTKVCGKIQSMGLKKNKNIDMGMFLNIEDSNLVYLLGLLWADGTMYNSTVVLECVIEDADVFEGYFKKICKYKSYIRNRGHRTQKSLNIGSSDLFRFLVEHDYDKKSYISPNKILSKIPDNLKYYFYRGILDGDGCFYYNKKAYLSQFSISGSYEQDWGYMVNLCDILGIKKYRIDKHSNKKGVGSMFRIVNKKEISIIGNYIYHNYDNDNIGLPRKYDKFLEIVS